MRFPGSLVGILGVALSAISVSTESRNASAQQVPDFRLEVDLVEVDVVVTGDDGRPIEGLTVDDFELREDGVPQGIAFFNAVATPTGRANALSEPGPPSDVQTNTNTIGHDGRLIVMVVDSQAGFLNTGRVRHVVREFVMNHLSDDDLAALVAGADVREWAFSGDKAALLAGVDSFVAGRPGDILETLESVASHLAPIRGRRKVLLLFSPGFNCEVDDSLGCPDRPALSVDVRQAIGAITRAGVSIYPVDIRGLAGPRDDEIAEPPISRVPEAEPQSKPGRQSSYAPMPGVAIRSLRALAARTGGVAFVNSNDFDAGFDRIMREAGNYYLLGYYPRGPRRPGALRRIGVRVRRPDVEVRSRSVYEEPRRQSRTDRASRTATLGKDASRDPLVALAGAPLPIHQGLGLAIQATPFGSRGQRGVVVVVVDVTGRDLELIEKGGRLTGHLRWLVLVTDRKGILLAKDGGDADLRLTPDRAARVKELGIRLASSFHLPPGHHRIRVAVQNGSARAGSLLADLEVPKTDSQTIGLSDILLTSRSAGTVPALRRLADLPMPALPSTRRTFSQDDTLVSAVYISVPATEGVIVTTTLRSNGGALQQQFEDRYGDQGAHASPHTHVKTLPLADVPPGFYVLEIRAHAISSRGAAAARRVVLEITPGR